MFNPAHRCVHTLDTGACECYNSRRNSTMGSSIQVNRRKLSELILYFSRRCDMLPSWGKTKLCKMLFHADFESFRRRGQPITGATYYRMPQGPVAKVALSEIDQLVEGGKLALIEREVGDYREKRPTALADPDLSAFSSSEMALIEQTIAILGKMTARQISQWSHHQPGWSLVEPDEEIPYFLGLNSVRKPTADEMDYARARLSAESP